MSLPTSFFIGRGSQGSLTFDVPNGLFTNVSGDVYFFDVDTETSVNLGAGNSSRYNFDPITGIAYVEHNSAIQKSIYSGGSWSNFNQNTMPWGFTESNGRIGGFFDNKALVLAPSNTYYGSLITGSSTGGTAPPRASGGLEDGTAYGDFLYVGGYGAVNLYQLFEGSTSYTTLQAPLNNNWGTACYDARTNIKYVLPQNQNYVSYYRNNNCLKALSFGSTSSYTRYDNTVPIQTTQYGPTCVGFDETTGSMNFNGFYYVGYTSGDNGVARVVHSTGATMTYNLGTALKVTPIYSFVQDAYFMFMENGYLKIPHLGNGELGNASTHGWGFSASGWRGPGSTTAQKSVSLVDRTKF
jgi:hypothetical protein